MSELKAISGHEIREDIDYNTRGIDPEDKEWNNYGKELCDTLYYLKSEADKVIAEKDKEIAELKAQKAQAEDDCAYWKTKAQRERHQKYKRCLAMADFCESQHDYYNTLGNGFWLVRGDKEKRDEYRKKASDFWWNWHKRWMKLAEKFEEAE